MQCAPNINAYEKEILKAEVGTRNRPSNWPFPEFQDPGIPEFQILDSGILEFWNSGNGKFEGRSGIRISAFKLAISGIPESRDPRIPDSGFWNSRILEFWKLPISRKK